MRKPVGRHGAVGIGGTHVCVYVGVSLGALCGAAVSRVPGHPGH